MQNFKLMIVWPILCFCLISTGNLFSAESKEHNKPYSKSEFIIPTKYEAMVKGYPGDWRRLTGYEFSGLHWNQFVVVFINENRQVYRDNYLEYIRVFEEDLDEGEDEDEIDYKKYPVGTMILKESFVNNNGKPHSALLLSGMIKHEEGYDQDFGNWEYFQSDTNGRILSSGNSKNKEVLKQCISCHQNIASRDYIFATQYSLTQ